VTPRNKRRAEIRCCRFTFTNVSYWGVFKEARSWSPHTRKETLTEPALRPEGMDTTRSSLAVVFAFLAASAIGLAYSGVNLFHDVAASPPAVPPPYLLLGTALIIALGFEFVNGFHDTANAVATVIYTHSLPPVIAVIWSGAWNLIGVLASSGAVAFGIVSLLPRELVLHVDGGPGFAMVFSLLIAAIIWNLGTWFLGLPSSSSHTLIGSIMGVGLMNRLMSPDGVPGTDIDWNQAINVGRSLLFSPLIGFFAAALVLLTAKALIRRPELYAPPKGAKPPPLWIRSLLVLTCTGVSFAHGSNDGQKGMGLIMLILIGTVPAAYGLNRAVPEGDVPDFAQVSTRAADALGRYETPGVAPIVDPRATAAEFTRAKTPTPAAIGAVRELTIRIANEVARHGTIAEVPAEMVNNVRNDMYATSEALSLILKSNEIRLSDADRAALAAYKESLDGATKFIPTWVKIAVALALGMGTMVGWKRIVVTVGEKIGKDHLTYGQGASAQLVAMGTILVASEYGLPVSTTHVLSSGVAGTMAANRSGLQRRTVLNLVMAWVLTLPISIALAAAVFWAARRLL